MNVIKWIIQKPSGSGVAVIQEGPNVRVVVVYGAGYKTDYPVQYEDGRISYDVEHSKTTKLAVEKAFRVKNNLLRRHDAR